VNLIDYINSKLFVSGTVNCAEPDCNFEIDYTNLRKKSAQQFAELASQHARHSTMPLAELKRILWQAYQA
jgi:uncharacterized protein YqfB (UPF0267 family)